MIKRLIYLLLVGGAILGLISLFTYDLIKIDWVSFMEIQPSYKPMENPLPVPADSIPVEGAVYTLGMGVSVNPVEADDVSIQRGAELYRINCVPCHGETGKGDGVIGTFFKYKPSDLTSFGVQQISDEAIFLIITNGVAGRMPPLNENLYVRERWDTVNFVRTLSASDASP
ncbi:MAG: c-type cytochrome [Acidobacteriaceae bacterium]